MTNNSLDQFVLSILGMLVTGGNGIHPGLVQCDYLSRWCQEVGASRGKYIQRTGGGKFMPSHLTKKLLRHDICSAIGFR